MSMNSIIAFLLPKTGASYLVRGGRSILSAGLVLIRSHFESLDNWLQETYTRGCHNCDNCNVDSDLLNDIQSGEKMSRLSEYAVCRAEEFSSPDEEAETKLLAFMQGEDNCPHWIGRN